MEESCDSVIKGVNIPFFEVEFTRGVRWGNSQITHIFCVYRILSYHIHFFFFYYPRRNMQDTHYQAEQIKKEVICVQIF